MNASSDPDRVFYDGTCGLCHGFVTFLLARDPDGSRFRFAPLQGRTFAALVPESERAGLPDSVVVRTHDGRLLIRSAGVAHALRRLGGLWSWVGTAIAIVPAFLADAVYDLVARARHRLFRRPDDACPVVPIGLRGRFEA